MTNYAYNHNYDSPSQNYAEMREGFGLSYDKCLNYHNLTFFSNKDQSVCSVLSILKRLCRGQTDQMQSVVVPFR